MIAFIIRRLGVLGVILFGSSFILYNLAALAGDPLGDLAFSDDEQAQQQIAGLRRQLRLDVPAPLTPYFLLRNSPPRSYQEVAPLSLWPLFT